MKQVSGEQGTRTRRLLAAALAMALGSGLAACTASKDVKQVEAQEAAPINCATAEGDIRVLQGEKASVADRMARGITAIVPAGAVVGIVGGQGGRQARDRVGRVQRHDRPADRGDPRAMQPAGVNAPPAASERRPRRARRKRPTPARP